MPMFSYIDEDDRLRGPFGDVQMHYWYLQAYLRPSLKIFVHYGLFGRPTTLGELMKKNGTSNPFYDGVAVEFTVATVLGKESSRTTSFKLSPLQERHRTFRPQVEQLCVLK
ncbi:GYF domain protein [Necator americanus]|uniref:GYF domain protein n=1 Tax=Necator americanus TaxID=51031 RepID=W2TXR5_NECAM|nr:GYF domain protein [Necator americanus]ETN85807.1 GYF domain protein [Necator americanus]